MLPHKPEPTVDTRPPFFISVATRYLLEKEIADGNIKKEDLPDLYKLAMLCGKLLGRKVPTMSDFQSGLVIRNIDNARKFASGDQDLDIVIYDNNGTMLPRKERIEYWRAFSKQLVAELDKKEV